MIIDFQNDPANAGLYEVCDAATLRPLGGWIFYADDSSGVVRRYQTDAKGFLLAAREHDPHTPVMEFTVLNGEVVGGPEICIAWIEERRPIRILRKRDTTPDYHGE